ncbi:acyl-CoA carboxylase epsilon subunit [Agromyces italicus]|uniref:acyl-CoA carboxylase epsilon subunit n=1 Tax=Agromyces italicus TaxID=279572 RepID=UPI0003B7A9A9|nr:acyl-CoA carboxylase epsilon subunit [Agromyces italicus]
MAAHDESAAPATAEAAAGDPRAADLRILSRSVSDEETAAVTAVLLAAADAEAPETDEVAPGRNAWVRSGGAIRRPVEVGPGSWVRSLR